MPPVSLVSYHIRAGALHISPTQLVHVVVQGKWSKEEDEQLRRLVGEKGSKWKEISTSLGRLPEGCRDRWRELKLGASKQSGRWSEEETEKLRALVNEYLARKQVSFRQMLSAAARLAAENIQV